MRSRNGCRGREQFARRGYFEVVGSDSGKRSVFPIPDEASAEIARRVADRLQLKL
jgi:hypothetical protein